MKYLIISDIHGSLYYIKKALEVFNKGKYDKLIILGDILYHGPRNDLPKDYNPKEIYPLLNSYKDKIIALKGNCDAEVDEMVLDFNLNDKLELNLNNKRCLLLHGQYLKFDVSIDNLNNYECIIYGHYHVYGFVKINNTLYINPGSISIPKEKNHHSYISFIDNVMTIKDLDTGKTLEKYEF